MPPDGHDEALRARSTRRADKWKFAIGGSCGLFPKAMQVSGGCTRPAPYYGGYLLEHDACCGT